MACKKEIVPLIHIKKGAEEKTFDGSGFLSIIDNHTVFVTCKHNFRNDENILTYFQYNKRLYLIDRNSHQYLAGDNRSHKRGWGFKTFVDEYAFLKLENFNIKIPLELMTTEDVKRPDELTLITHKNNGEQIEIECERMDMNEYARYIDETRKVEASNMISLKCYGQKKGYSGGSIIHNQSQKCIGILFSGSDVTISIIKAQSIIDRFRELNH